MEGRNILFRNQKDPPTIIQGSGCVEDSYPLHCNVKAQPSLAFTLKCKKTVESDGLRESETLKVGAVHLVKGD